MIAVVWQFDVKGGSESQFEDFFGAGGEWAAVSRHARSYIGSSFLRDQNRPSRYLVIEYWSELVVAERHRMFRSDELATLERRRDAMVNAVEPLGIFTALSVPERVGPTWSQEVKPSPGPRKRSK
jgi:hypothetical protein